MASCGLSPAAIRYVNHKASGTESGASWTNAFKEVGPALAASTDRDEIWIAAGTYYPDYDPSTRQHNGNRDLRFRLKPGVSLFGGFAGGETSRTLRDWIANPVIFSGDIGQRHDFTDNTRTILEVPTGNPRSTIEGIVFMLGNANIPTELGGGDVAGAGGAIWARGDVRIRFCTFVGNYAIYGGAIYAEASAVRLINCIFHDNKAQYVGGAFRVGIEGDLIPGSEVINCTVTNCAASRGGAFTAGARSIVKNNVVWGNTGSTGWELVEIWTDATVSNNIVQESLERYPAGGIISDPLIISTPSAGVDGLWGTADDDYFGGGIASNSPARDMLAPADLPPDVTDLDGDSSTNDPIPFDSLRRSRPLGGLSDAGALELRNVPPIALQLDPFAVEENKPAGTRVGGLSSTDANAGTFVYSLVAGEGDNDNAVFRVRGANLETTTELDFESKATYSVRLRTTDSLGLFFDQVLQLAVIDVTDQRVSVQAPRPHAYFPFGGIPPVEPGQWPAHCGIVTVTRTGQIVEGLSMFLELAGSAVYGDHYLVIPEMSTPAVLNNGRLSMTFEPAQSILTFGVCPLFPDEDEHFSRNVRISVGDGGVTYDIDAGAGFATIVVHPSPRSAWSATHPQGSPGAVGYMEQLFPADFITGVGFQPVLEYTRNPDSGGELVLLARPSLTNRDLHPTFQISHDLTNWESVRAGLNPRAAGWMEYRFPTGDFPSTFVRTSAEVRTAPLDRTTGGEFPLSMIGMPAGRIIMGSPAEAAPNVRNVQITQPFWMGRTEVTRAQFAAVMKSTAPVPAHAAFPVTEISWDDAAFFATQLTSSESEAGRLPAGYVYRLPTEAEWEYASSGGTEMERWLPASATPPDCVWYDENSFAVSHRVSLKEPNPWGLHDMYGNAAEWVADWHASPGTGVYTDPSGPVAGTTRTVRGGHFNLGISAQTSWWRSSTEPSTVSPNLGFRVALAIPLQLP